MIKTQAEADDRIPPESATAYQSMMKIMQQMNEQQSRKPAVRWKLVI